MRPGAWPRAPRDHPRVWGNCNAFCDYSNITLNLSERESKKGSSPTIAAKVNVDFARVNFQTSSSFSAKTVKNCQKLEIKMMSGGAEGLGAVVVKCTAPGKSTLFISTFPTSPLSLPSSDHIQHFSPFLHFSGLDIKPSRARHCGKLWDCKMTKVMLNTHRKYLIKNTTNIPDLAISRIHLTE